MAPLDISAVISMNKLHTELLFFTQTNILTKDIIFMFEILNIAYSNASYFVTYVKFTQKGNCMEIRFAGRCDCYVFTCYI